MRAVPRPRAPRRASFSALQRAEIAEIGCCANRVGSTTLRVSVLFNEPKLLKFSNPHVLEPTLEQGFSALQRAEIAEIDPIAGVFAFLARFSALQRAEIAEMVTTPSARSLRSQRFSALQRAEIAEIPRRARLRSAPNGFSALQRAEIAEIPVASGTLVIYVGFSALQRAEIAEIQTAKVVAFLYF